MKELERGGDGGQREDAQTQTDEQLGATVMEVLSFAVRSSLCCIREGWSSAKGRTGHKKLVGVGEKID